MSAGTDAMRCAIRGNKRISKAQKQLMEPIVDYIEQERRIPPDDPTYWPSENKPKPGVYEYDVVDRGGVGWTRRRKAAAS